jgi:hypothetical protein
MAKVEELQEQLDTANEKLTAANDKAKELRNTIKMSRDAKQTLALQSKVVLLTEEKTAIARELKAAVKQHGIYRSLVEEMHAIVSPLDALPPATDYRNGPEKLHHETLVMHLSDEHADETVLPHMVGGLETYNMSVALCRAEKYVDTVLQFTQKTLVNYQFDKLVILSYGDHTSGEIHGGVGHSENRNMFRNALQIGQMQALMIRDLAPYFKEIEVLCIPGNHGRRSIKKDYNGPWDNWDYLISEIAKQHCANLTNVTFHIPECFSVVTNIEGHNFFIAHGDDIKSWNSIPFYGLERKTRRLVALHNAMTGTQVKYFVFGHFHMNSVMSDLNCETIINGAWIGTNPYGYESFSGYREPSQLIHGVNEKYGITWRLHVKLKDSEQERLGPQRYQTVLAAPEMGM